MRDDKTKLTPVEEPKDEPSTEALKQAREDIQRAREATEHYNRGYFDYYDDVKISHREDW